MCGLVGVVERNMLASTIEAFFWMHHFNITRGEDSSGIFLRFSDRPASKNFTAILKAEGHPSNLHYKYPEFFNSKGRVSIDASTSIHMIMGHCRAKTIGDSSVKNAHPFKCDHITGAHNGTTNALSSLKEFDSKCTSETDSERLFWALASGYSLEKLVKTVDGAMALSWYDSKEKTFNLYRNSGRPLFYCLTSSGKLFYASEKWMLEKAFDKTKETQRTIVEVPTGTHLKFRFADTGFQIKLTSELIVKTVSPPTTYNHVGNGVHYLNNHKRVLPEDSDDIPKFLVNHKKKEETSSPVPFSTSDSGWLQLRGLTKEDFRSKYCNCSYCQTNLDFEDYQNNNVVFLDIHTPLCDACSKEFS